VDRDITDLKGYLELVMLIVLLRDLTTTILIMCLNIMFDLLLYVAIILLDFMLLDIILL